MAISTGNAGGSSVNAEINVTPMIDVMLVLLIIFMIVTPVLASGFTATMPAGVNVKSEAEEDNEIMLGLDNQGRYFLNGQLTTSERVEDQLRSLYAASGDDKRMFFKADAGLPYSKIQEAVEMGRRAGARMLVAITDRRGGFSGETEEP